MNGDRLPELPEEIARFMHHFKNGFLEGWKWGDRNHYNNGEAAWGAYFKHCVDNEAARRKEHHESSHRQPG